MAALNAATTAAFCLSCAAAILVTVKATAAVAQAAQLSAAADQASSSALAASGRPQVEAQWWHSRAVEVPLSQVDFDLDLTHGQLRPINPSRVADTRLSFERSMPAAPVQVILVQKDHTGI